MNRARHASILAGAVALGAATLALGLGGCAPSREPSVQETATVNPVAGLQTQDLVVGPGAEATAGARVTVHYTGWLYDGAAPDH